MQLSAGQQRQLKPGNKESGDLYRLLAIVGGQVEKFRSQKKPDLINQLEEATGLEQLN